MRTPSFVAGLWCEGGNVRRVTVSAVVIMLLAGAPLARAGFFSSLTTTITMDCSTLPAVCKFNSGNQGSPEQGMANFNSMAPGWSATFDSAPAISWGVILGTYQAEFGMGGAFAIVAPGGLQLSGVVTSGVAFRFPEGTAETAALFQGYWNDGMFATGDMVWNNFEPGAPVTLDVTTYTPEPGSFLLFGSAFAVLAGIVRRTLH
jgi:hypothetical protein